MGGNIRRFSGIFIFSLVFLAGEAFGVTFTKTVDPTSQVQPAPQPVAPAPANTSNVIRTTAPVGAAPRPIPAAREQRQPIPNPPPAARPASIPVAPVAQPSASAPATTRPIPRVRSRIPERVNSQATITRNEIRQPPKNNQPESFQSRNMCLPPPRGGYVFHNGPTGPIRKQKDKTNIIRKVMKDMNEPSDGGKPYASLAAPYNKYVLEAVKNMRSAGGYHLTQGGFTQRLSTPNGFQITSGGKKTSMCTSATYEVFHKAMSKIQVQTPTGPKSPFHGMRPEQLNQFKPSLAKEDNHNFWGLWNNNFKGMGDTCEKLADYCKTFSAYIPGGKGRPGRINRKAINMMVPGDFVFFSRPGGHSVVFLGWADAAKTKMIYWSSNKGTNGFGVQVENVNTFNKMHVARITNPENLKNMPNARRFGNDKMGWRSRRFPKTENGSARICNPLLNGPMQARRPTAARR